MQGNGHGMHECSSRPALAGMAHPGAEDGTHIVAGGSGGTIVALNNEPSVLKNAKSQIV